MDEESTWQYEQPIQQRDPQDYEWRWQGIIGSFQLKSPQPVGCAACALKIGPRQSSSGPKLPSLGSSLPDQKRVALDLYSNIHSWQTRLICLGPGSGSDDLKSSLHVADLVVGRGAGLPNLSCEVMYEALSYTWVRCISPLRNTRCQSLRRGWLIC